MFLVTINNILLFFCSDFTIPILTFHFLLLLYLYFDALKPLKNSDQYITTCNQEEHFPLWWLWCVLWTLHFTINSKGTLWYIVLIWIVCINNQKCMFFTEVLHFMYPLFTIEWVSRHLCWLCKYFPKIFTVCSLK